MQKLLDFLYINLHKSMLIRRLIILWSLSMSTWITYEMIKLITHADKLDMALATVVGAVFTPVLGLTGALLKFYAQHKYQDECKVEEK